MKIISYAFKNNDAIPDKYTCHGDDISPALEINDVPQGAKSLALIVSDPDASSGGFIHWLLWNIKPETTVIEEGNAPEGSVQGENSGKKNVYIGPCPPSGMHHYHFKIYALDDILNLTPDSKKDDLEKAMEYHVIDSAEIVGTYKKK